MSFALDIEICGYVVTGGVLTKALRKPVQGIFAVGGTTDLSLPDGPAAIM
jgi:hypothetical protein